MKKTILIVLGEPQSINSEIIIKAWKKVKKKILIIGNYEIMKKEIQKLKKKIPLHLTSNFNLLNNKLNIFNVDLKNNNKKKYILDCLNLAHELQKNFKFQGFINAPIKKKNFNTKYLGVTEYLAKKNKVLGKEIMMIYNKKLSVVPLTTHISIKQVTRKITKNLIKNKVSNLNIYYQKVFKKKPNIILLGLNPHNDENKKNSIENKIIKPSILELKKLKIKVKGPISADTAFTKANRKKIDIIVGMYHDQVLAPFKALYEFDAINITLGLKYLRISPDHGTAENIMGKGIANPKSLINAINFLSQS